MLLNVTFKNHPQSGHPKETVFVLSEKTFVGWQTRELSVINFRELLDPCIFFYGEKLLQVD